MINNLNILCGDSLQVLKTLPANSINCCVTSPPYYNLRDYGQDGQIGQEKTPEEFVQKLVELFREVRRVLTDDGTLWLNLGDSYAGSMKGSNGDGTWNDRTGTKQGTNHGALGVKPTKAKDIGLKPKDLIGIPWMVAFALRADGWTLRQDIIWAKPNPMPESVTDRCTKAHEYLFLLTKSKKYHFDNEAIKVPSKQDWGTRDRTKGKYHNEGSGLQPHTGLTKSYPMANKRSVWSITANPFKGAHFATFPPELVEPCIKAGCPVDGTVLDPFGGSGTTGMVALQLGRKAVLIELNPEYIPLIEQRCGGVQSLLPLVEDTTTLSQSVSG